MPSCQIDHIAVTAPSLAAGSAFIAQTLGVEPQPGGEHPRMGTHNRLLRLGPSLYLEVIAANPAAPAPQRPRWFGLDRLAADAPPALSAWIARTTDIHAAAAACAEPLGEIEPMSRGNLHWQITIPADGSLPLGGAGPALIEWAAGAPPAARLEDHGLELARLEIFHPDPGRVERLLASLGLQGPVAVSATSGSPYLVAQIDTPTGRRQLSTAGRPAA